MKPIENDNGITIKQLKDLVRDLPEQDENGEDYEVWISGEDGYYSNSCKDIRRLNRGDIILSI